MKLTSLRTAVVIVASCGALYITGCKENTVDNSATVSDSDVAGTIAASLGGPSNGMTKQTESAASIATTGNLGIASKSGAIAQGTSRDTSVSVTGTTTINGGTYTYDYLFTAHSNFHLINGGTSSNWVADSTASVDLGFTMNGQYDTPNATGNDAVNATWTVSDIPTLTPLLSPLMLNGTYARYGKITGKAQGNSFTYNDSLYLTNIQVTRLTRRIAGGTATVKVIGNLMDASNQILGDYNFTGVITFYGNEQAELLLTNVKTGAQATFIIDMSKSSAVRKP